MLQKKRKYGGSFWIALAQLMENTCILKKVVLFPQVQKFFQYRLIVDYDFFFMLTQDVKTEPVSVEFTEISVSMLRFNKVH